MDNIVITDVEVAKIVAPVIEEELETIMEQVNTYCKELTPGVRGGEPLTHSQLFGIMRKMFESNVKFTETVVLRSMQAYHENFDSSKH